MKKNIYVINTNINVKNLTELTIEERREINELILSNFKKSRLNTYENIYYYNDNTNNKNKMKASQDMAFGTPDTTYDAHKAYYWALSGGYPYPYPFPMMYYPSTDMNKVHGIENKI